MSCRIDLPKKSLRPPDGIWTVAHCRRNRAIPISVDVFDRKSREKIEHVVYYDEARGVLRRLQTNGRGFVFDKNTGAVAVLVEKRWANVVIRNQT
jgi:hypothetical protein